MKPDQSIDEKRTVNKKRKVIKYFLKLTIDEDKQSF